VRSISRVAVTVRPNVDAPLDLLERVAGEAGVELVFDEETLDVDLALVIGGDGTMLRTLQRFLGTGVAVIGANFGRFGFLASIRADEVESGVRRAFAGDLAVSELATVELEADGVRRIAVNDVFVASSDVGRMVELSWEVGGEALGKQPCDGIICSAPSGSTAYNLSSGGPVLVWGLDAMVVTFVSPHALHVRPLVVPRGLDVEVRNCTEGVAASVIADGHAVASLGPGEHVVVRMGAQGSLLASLPEVTFFRRFRDNFAT
jgi:NAD+ kinase